MLLQLEGWILLLPGGSANEGGTVTFNRMHASGSDFPGTYCAAALCQMTYPLAQRLFDDRACERRRTGLIAAILADVNGRVCA